VTDPLVVAGVAAAGAASLSALVVAWQAFETRRAANAAVASLDLTRSAQGAAEQSLAAAVQLASEAARSRRDARAPLIDVRLQGQPVWPPLQPSSFGGEPQPLRGTKFRVPKDEDQQVLVRQRLLVTNREAYPVALQATQIVPEEQPGVMNVPLVHVEPGDTVSLLCQEARSLRAWIGVAEDREAGRPGAEVIGMLWHSDSYDDGVVVAGKYGSVGARCSPSQKRSAASSSSTIGPQGRPKRSAAASCRVADATFCPRQTTASSPSPSTSRSSGPSGHRIHSSRQTSATGSVRPSRLRPRRHRLG